MILQDDNQCFFTYPSNYENYGNPTYKAHNKSLGLEYL